MREKLKAQLLALQATSGRSAVEARHRFDTAAERAALLALRDVKVALSGNDGSTLRPDDNVSPDERIRCTILSLLRCRGADKSICPSEVARVIGPPNTWRVLMPAVRAAAVKLAADKVLRITRGEEELNPDDLVKGPIRLRQGDLF